MYQRLVNRNIFMGKRINTDWYWVFAVLIYSFINPNVNPTFSYWRIKLADNEWRKLALNGWIAYWIAEIREK